MSVNVRYGNGDSGRSSGGYGKMQWNDLGGKMMAGREEGY